MRACSLFRFVLIELGIEVNLAPFYGYPYRAA